MLPIESMTNEQLQNEIKASEHRVATYHMYLDLLSATLEKVKNDQPVKFRSDSPLTETTPKEQKIKYFEESIETYTTMRVGEQQNMEKLKKQLYRT